MSADQSTYRIGKCRWCGERGEVYRDNGLCEDCDSNTIHCRICRCRQHADNRCRHVFQDRWFEWAGAGSGCEPTPAVKSAFLELLTLMPEGFAADLRTAIKGGEFYTWVIAPMIGGGGILEMHGMPLSKFLTYGDDMLALGERHDAEETADGYRWLASLYQRKTLKANRLTIRWIDEWQRDRVPISGAWFWHWPRTPEREGGTK